MFCDKGVASGFESQSVGLGGVRFWVSGLASACYTYIIHRGHRDVECFAWVLPFPHSPGPATLQNKV